MIKLTCSLIRAALPACVLVSPISVLAAYTSIGGGPLGDPFAGVDWNVTDRTGASLFRKGFSSGSLLGPGGVVIGN
jgi:hypothetical protein